MRALGTRSAIRPSLIHVEAPDYRITGVNRPQSMLQALRVSNASRLGHSLALLRVDRLSPPLD